MLPITEFHLAFCGIATVAATVGYACARQAALTLASPKETKADVEAGPREERSLKRKLDDSDDGESDTEQQPRPMKRSKTPPTDQRETDEDEWEVIVAPPTYEEAVALPQPNEPVQDSSALQDDNSSHRNTTPIRENTPPLHAEQQVAEEEPRPTSQCSQLSPEALPERARTPSPNPAAAITSLPANPFSTFASSSSPFASYSSATGVSPFALAGQTVKSTPAWRRVKEDAGDAPTETSPANALAPSPNNALSPVTTESSPASVQNKNAIEAGNRTQALGQSSSFVTGEEDETVVAELKGVKLFTKRGRKEFTDGMYGHIKILFRSPALSTPKNTTDKASQENTKPRTRLLFRRDPLGQVSMNVGLCSTVRCHFDAAENILRVILMEQVMDGKESKEDVVVYALKPGRSQKQDFQSFAKTLCDNEETKSRPVAAAVTTSTVTDAAAS
ncbi:hypothetical protein PAXRUDRAFT_703745 [Paxillus rubicundulus Ve08.2h10]|uniref:RanBD1 domain-containing protein n=1 Tax=Paxillus rubicundulus Ve08.2h10 TaxID=930991 RepID=A0A0D0DT74_9AGAM|nr:hypothetical protein PAXRUDRAFT_703745 [Paxillus rubicundulus Ve08.2h10]